MHPASPYQLLSIMAGAVICFAASSAETPSGLTARLSVDMPHGGCRLTVWQHGAASIDFGAMPKRVRVGAGAFAFEQLARDLQDKAYVQSAVRPSRVPIGGLSLPDSNELLFIHDEALVKSLLQRAWSARLLPTTAQEVEDYKWIAEACSLR